MIADYMCAECKEIFENTSKCAFHHLEFKHQNFELIGSDLKMVIKSENGNGNGGK